MSATASPVLIVGSGPTGLVLACELLSLGIPCRIVDRLSEPVSTSRSFTIHARTLELLDKLGLVEEFLAHGHKGTWMEYHFQGQEETTGLNFTEIDSLYPFCLFINQRDTEAILRRHVIRLGGQIEWNRRLTHLEQSDNFVTATLENPLTGETEIIQADWVVGCDGFYSAVRQTLNLAFDGEQFAGQMRMMDVSVKGFDYDPDRIHFFVAQDHMLLIAQLPGKNYRVLISDLSQSAQTELQTARSDFQAVVDQHFQGAVQLGEPEWTTLFKIHRRRVDTYRQGRILLAGDAAHINSPAGGQGMNVSMQDSFNLGWKLALVLKGQAHESLIDTYEQERAPVAVQMQEGTKAIHSIILAHGSGIEERIALSKAPGWRRKAASQVAGLSYTYRNPDNAAALITGDRAPDMVIGDTHIYGLLDAAVPTLFLMLPNGSTNYHWDVMTGIAHRIGKESALPITIRFIVPSDLGQQLSPHKIIIVDRENRIRTCYNAVDQMRLYLIRPDRYIGIETDSVVELLAYLQTYASGPSFSTR